jgi:hypothetical protein
MDVWMVVSVLGWMFGWWLVVSVFGWLLVCLDGCYFKIQITNGKKVIFPNEWKKINNEWKKIYAFRAI